MFARATPARSLEFDPAAAPATRFQGPPGCALPSRRKHALTTTNIIAFVWYPGYPTVDIRYHHILYDVTIVIIVADSAPSPSVPIAVEPELHWRWLDCANNGALGHSNGISGARANTRLEFRYRIFQLLSRGYLFAHDLDCDIRLLITTITDSSQWDHPMPKQCLQII